MSVSRVTLLTETYAPVVGGGEAQAARLAAGLARRGVRVTLLTRRVSRGLPSAEVLDGVDVRRVPPRGRGTVPKWALAATTLPRLLEDVGRSDAFIACGYRVLGLPSRLIGAAARIPTIFKADSQGEMSGAYFRAGLAAMGLSHEALFLRPACAARRAILAGADAFVSISSPIEVELRAAGIDPGRIHRIPNGVDPDHFSPSSQADRSSMRHALGLAHDSFVVCYTGRLVRYKGLMPLVAAWSEVTRRLPGATLLLVGEGGLDVHACEQELREDVERRGLSDSVRFTGPVEDVAPFLQASDAFAFPTEREAFGLSLVEAMACGLACVTTAVDGLADFVTDGENALTIAPGDERGLADALLRVRGDAPAARSLGRAARETALRRFATDSVVDAWLALVERVVRERRA